MNFLHRILWNKEMFVTITIELSFIISPEKFKKTNRDWKWMREHELLIYDVKFSDGTTNKNTDNLLNSSKETGL
jgi:hypothetical protein